MMEVRPVRVCVHDGFVPVPMGVRNGDGLGMLVQVMAIVMPVGMDVLCRAVGMQMHVPAGHQHDHRDQKYPGRQRLHRRHLFPEEHE